MYYFEAHYTNIYTFEKITRKISFDGQFFHEEKECYMLAMSRAYDMAADNEILDGVEFIAC